MKLESSRSERHITLRTLLWKLYADTEFKTRSSYTYSFSSFDSWGGSEIQQWYSQFSLMHAQWAINLWHNKSQFSDLLFSHCNIIWWAVPSLYYSSAKASCHPQLQLMTTGVPWSLSVSSRQALTPRHSFQMGISAQRAAFIWLSWHKTALRTGGVLCSLIQSSSACWSSGKGLATWASGGSP